MTTAANPLRTSKYSARRTEYPPGSGQVYASAAEARRAQALDLLKAAGQIEDWWRPQRLIVWQHGKDKISYQPDFGVRLADGTIWMEDVKGMPTAVWKIKALLFRAAYPEIELRVIPANEVR